jgi:hypothetical protein
VPATVPDSTGNVKSLTGIFRAVDEYNQPTSKLSLNVVSGADSVAGEVAAGVFAVAVRTRDFAFARSVIPIGFVLDIITPSEP